MTGDDRGAPVLQIAPPARAIDAAFSRCSSAERDRIFETSAIGRFDERVLAALECGGGFGEGGIEIEGALSGVAGFGCGFADGHGSENGGTRDGIAIGERGIGESVVRILMGGLFEITDGLVKILIGSFVPVEAAL